MIFETRDYPEGRQGNSRFVEVTLEFKKWLNVVRNYHILGILGLLSIVIKQSVIIVLLNWIKQAVIIVLLNWIKQVVIIVL